MKRNILAIILLIIAFLSGCNSKEDFKTADEIYAEYIEKVRTGFEDDFQSITVEDLDISVIFNFASETMGYHIVDLDRDGTNELLFGENGEGAWANIIYDIYTVTNGKIVHVIDGWDRNRYYLCDTEECIIANEGSSGASNSVYAYYGYKNGGLELIEAVIYDEKDEENLWFYNTEDITAENAEPISEDRAREIIEGYTYREIEYVKFIRK